VRDQGGDRQRWLSWGRSSRFEDHGKLPVVSEESFITSWS
jgi:hypothetical protein